MGPNMTNRLVVPCPVNQHLLSLLSLYHSDTDHLPIINLFSYLFFSIFFPIPRGRGGGGEVGGAMVLGKLPVPGRPTIWVLVGQRPIALAVGAGGVVWTFFLSFLFSLPPSLSGRRPNID